MTIVIKDKSEAIQEREEIKVLSTKWLKERQTSNPIRKNELRQIPLSQTEAKELPKNKQD